MQKLLAGTLVIAMLLSGVSLPAGAATSDDRTPRGPPEMLAALDAALASSQPPNMDDVLIPGPEGAQAYALGVLAAEGTPERLAATLDAIEAGRDVAMRDYLVAGALMHYAGPGYTGDLLSERARSVVEAALPLRLEATAVPVGISAVPPEVPTLPAVDPAPASSFGDVEVLSTTGRILRVDDLRVDSSQLLDYTAVLSSVYQNYDYDYVGSYYSYYYSDWWTTYYYSYYYYSNGYSQYSSYQQTVSNLLQYRAHFDQWRFTSGVNVQVFEQTADAGPSACVAEADQCVDAPATAHMLYTVVTPYAFIDHWWLMVFLEDLSQQIYSSWYSYASGYWYESSYWWQYYYGYYYSGYYYNGNTYNYYASGSYATSNRYTSYSTNGGVERIPIDDLPALRDVRIRVFAPLDQYLALARADSMVVDMATAVTMDLPNQVGVEYKDTKLSEILATTPALTDLSIVVDEAPYLSAGLTSVDEATLAGTGVVTVATGAADGATGAAAVIAADPASFAQVTAAGLEAAANAAAGDASALALTVQADPAGYAQARVDEAIAAAGAAAAAAAQAAGDVEGTLQQGVTAEVPAVEDPVFLVAEYAASELRTGTSGGAGFGLLSLRAYPADSDPVIVRVDAAGLGLPVIFEVDLQRGTAVPNEVTVVAPAAPAAAGIAGAMADPREDLERMKQAVLAMPFEASLPAFLAQERILDDPAGWAKARIQRTLTPDELASTLVLMGSSSLERPVVHGDLVEATAVLWYAGAGYEQDPAFGDWARATLTAALPAYLAAGGALGEATVDVVEPGLPAEAQQAVDDADAAAAGAVAQANQAIAPTVDPATRTRLDEVRAAAIDGAAFRWDTYVSNARSDSYDTYQYLSAYASGSTYGDYYQYSTIYNNWEYYYYYYVYYNDYYSQGYTYDLQRFASLRTQYTRTDVVDSVTAAMVVLGGTQRLAAAAALPADPGPLPCPAEVPECPAAATGASVDEAALDGNVVYTVLFPFRFTTNWFLSTVFDSYQRDYLTSWYYYWNYYNYYVSNWGSSYYQSYGGDAGSYGYTYTQTSFRVQDRTEVIAVPNVALSGGAQIVATAPLKEYALMAQGPAPFDMGTVFRGDLPFQAQASREGQFFGDTLVVSPAPNDLNIVVDEDLLLAGPGATAAQAELQALSTAGQLEAALAALAADPVGGVSAMVPAVDPAAVDPAAVAASLEQQAAAALAMVPGPAQVQALADGTAALLLDIVANPQAFADATAAQAAAAAAQAEADARATTVEVGAQPVPSAVDDRAVYEAVFEATAVASFRPGVVAVGLVGLDGAALLDPEEVVVTIQVQGLEGNNALGATGPLVLRFATDLNGQGPLPAETPSASANVGQALDDAAAAVPPAPASQPTPQAPVVAVVSRQA